MCLGSHERIAVYGSLLQLSRASIDDRQRCFPEPSSGRLAHLGGLHPVEFMQRDRGARALSPEMKKVKSRTGVPRMLEHEARQSFWPAVRGRLTRPAPDPMLVQRLDYSRPRELQRPVAPAEVPLILTRVAKSLPYEVA
jgi:hypothetical protein